MDVLKSGTAPLTISNYSSGADVSSKKATSEAVVVKPEEVKKPEDTPKLVDELNSISDSLNVDVKFAYNDKIGEVYINVLDKKTGEVINKYPTEEAMKIKEAMKDFVGSLFDKKG